VQTVTKHTTKSKSLVETVSLLYGSLNQATAAILVGTALMTYFHAGVLSNGLVYGWMTYMLLIGLSRFISYILFHLVKPDERGIKNWANIFQLLSGLVGVGWGIAAYFFIQAEYPILQAMLTLTIIGYMAGAMTTLSVYLPAFFSMIIPALLLLIIRTFSLGGEVNYSLVFMLIMFSIFIIGGSRKLNATLKNAFELRFRNEALNVELGEKIINQEKTKNQLIEANVKAQQANVAKSQFIANMSHEIRTPMNAIIGMTRLALESDENDKQRNYIQKANISANNLLGIINDILDYSKIEAGKLELESTDFSLAHVIDETFNIVKLKAEENAIQLTADVQHEVPNNLIGDPLRLKQVLINLINNAIKFSKSGDLVTLEVRPREFSDNFTILHFIITDNGIGMNIEQQKKLFQSFTQADGSTSRKYGGTGLGLTISKQLTELMGGEIWVDSQKDQGSKFHFTAKFQLSDDSADAISDHEDSKAALRVLKGASILLVEDNEINQELAMEVLTMNGLTVTTANNGQEALELLEQQQFDGVLMDCQMPVLDGYEATRKIRQQAKFRELPVIAMTANAMKQDIQQALDSGMNDHIAKPFDPDIMFTTMAKWIKRS